MTPLWSLARWQLYEFCPRAYFFRYFMSSRGWKSDPSTLSASLKKLRKPLSRKERINEIIGDLLAEELINPPVNIGRCRTEAVKRWYRRNGDDEGVEDLLARLDALFDSEFFLQLSAADGTFEDRGHFVSYELAGIKVLIRLELLWYENSRLNIVCFSGSDNRLQAASLRFYALKSAGIDTDRVNSGFLSYDNGEWICRWVGADLEEMMIFQERLLSFPFTVPPEELAHCQDSSKCLNCVYSAECDRPSE